MEDETDPRQFLIIGAVASAIFILYSFAGIALSLMISPEKAGAAIFNYPLTFALIKHALHYLLLIWFALEIYTIILLKGSVINEVLVLLFVLLLLAMLSTSDLKMQENISLIVAGIFIRGAQFLYSRRNFRAFIFLTEPFEDGYLALCAFLYVLTSIILVFCGTCAAGELTILLLKSAHVDSAILTASVRSISCLIGFVISGLFMIPFIILKEAYAQVKIKVSAL